MIAFRQFLRKYGITLLPVSIQTTTPGDILKKKKRSYYPYTSLHKWSDLPVSKWKTGWTGAHITQEKISRTLSLQGKYSLKGMGVDIAGGLGKVKSATYTITGVKAKKLESLDTLQIEAILAGIKSQKKGTWRKLRGNHLVELTFYATDFTIDFEVEGDLNLKAEIGEKVTHAPNTSIKWTSRKSLKIAQNDAIPFGIKRFRIK